MTEYQIRRADVSECLLCRDPACTAACPHGLDPGRTMRSLWFDNAGAAALSLTENFCSACAGDCEKACRRPGRIRIRERMERLFTLRETDEELRASADFREICLQTDFCGIPLENPFLLSSSVVASTYDMCARAFEAGWAGAAFKTICNFEIHEASPRFSAIEGDNGGFIGFKNIEQLSDHSVEENMQIFRELKKNYPTKFILASIMGQNEQEWAELARKCEENGADAIELNFSCPNMAEGGLGSDIGQCPELVEQLTRAAKNACSIPVVAKLTPNVASMKDAAEAAKRGGADGVAAINTIKSVTGVNLHTYVSEPSVHGRSAFGGYSGAAVKPIALRFIAELGINPELKGLHISGMGGIETWRDAAEFLLLGAGSLQITTAVMKYGYRIIEDLKSGLALYMKEMGFASVGEMVGLGLDSIYASTDALERDTVIYPRFIRERCLGCGRCVISCSDGGHQALSQGEDGRVILHGAKCVGCHLCILVCPQKAIVPGRKRVPLLKQD